MQAFVSQNYEGFGQSQSASSTSLPKEPHSHTPVSQNRQGHGHTPKETGEFFNRFNENLLRQRLYGLVV